MIIKTLEKLEELSSTKMEGKEKVKESIIRDAVTRDELFMDVLYYALNPYLTYHVQNLDLDLGTQGEPCLGDTQGTWFAFFSVLDALHHRELTGNHAKECLTNILMDMYPDVREYALRVVQKNLRIGVGAKTVNKIFPEAIPEFQVMLAKELDCVRNGDIKIRQKIKFPVWVDWKLDGTRLIGIVDGGSVSLLSRKGHQITTLPGIEAELLRISKRGEGNFVVDGEIMGENWNETQSTVFATVNKTGDANLTYNVFDILPLSAWFGAIESDPYKARRNQLEAASWNGTQVKAVPGKYVFDMSEIKEYFEEALNLGYEGIMVKNPDALYQFKRTSDMLKMKPKGTWEGAIVGWHEGKGKLKGKFGAFVAEIENSPTGVTTLVGGGFTDAQREAITVDLQTDPDAYNGVNIEVEAQEMTKDGTLRFPVFKRFRNTNDK